MVKHTSLLLPTAATGSGLFDSLIFKNAGVVNGSDAFSRTWFDALYLECENCSKAQYSWAIRGANYLFRQEAPDQCVRGKHVPGFDRPGGDLHASAATDVDSCATNCCGNRLCQAYVFATAPADFKDCKKGERCCYLKSSVTEPKASTLADIATGTVAHSCSLGSRQDGFDRPGGDMEASRAADADDCAERCCSASGCAAYVFAVAQSDFGSCKAGDACCYLKSRAGDAVQSHVANITTGTVAHDQEDGNPPIGMRSAVPLGGLGAGSFEIRADGSIKEVTIINQSPGGAAKMGIMDGFVFAVREGSSNTSKLLRTRAPEGFPSSSAATALRYQGAYPVSKLELLDSEMELSASLYAFSRYRINDLDRSVLPAVALSLEAKAGHVDETAEYFVTLPLAVEEHYARRGSKDLLATSQAASAADCLKSCHDTAACVSWMWEAAKGVCSTMGDAPLGAYEDSVFSGIKGTWAQTGDCLTLNRPLGGPAAGNASLCAAPGQQLSFATGSSPQELYKAFTSGAMTGVAPEAAYGAIAVSAAVPAGVTKELSVAFSWFFPARDYMDQVLGNYYATQHNDSAAVGVDLLSDLQTTVKDISNFQRPLLGSTLPDWLADTLHNSVSHVRSAWLEKNRQWRQWEAYDCVNVDSIHNDGERHIPYLTFMPETTRSKMHAWAATQQADGMLPEQLACGCMGPVDRHLDAGCGRVMSDVSSMFVVYLLEFYKWANDEALVKALWPVAKRAAQWHLDTAAASGVPEHQCNTYDILGPEHHSQVSYNSAFHLLGLRAAEELARSPLVGDAAFADTCAAAFKRGQQTLEQNQWIDRGAGKGYYSFAVEDNSSLMVDTFYPQVLSYSLGLGALVDEERLLAHLQTEVEWNDSPYGLVVKSTGAGASRTNGVWQMGSPNWGSLNLHLGRPLAEALEQPRKSLSNWRNELRDLWNVAGIADQDSGLPSITSHYGYYMSAWHLLLALSGQQADLPKGQLSFRPKVEAPYTLPVLLPGTVGILRRGDKYELELTSGALDIASLTVDDCPHPGQAQLKAGDVLSWVCDELLI